MNPAHPAERPSHQSDRHGWRTREGHFRECPRCQMGITRRPSCVSLPDASKPYPTILSFLVQRFPKVSQALWEQRIADHKVIDDAGTPITMATPYLPQKRIHYFREVTAEPSIPLQEKILFQNDELLVACKPPFLPVTPSKRELH